MSVLKGLVLLDKREEYKNMNKEITVYSKPSCKNCTLLKMWLNSAFESGELHVNTISGATVLSQEASDIMKDIIKGN